jgi:hypothetical protein
MTVPTLPPYDTPRTGGRTALLVLGGVLTAGLVVTGTGSAVADLAQQEAVERLRLPGGAERVVVQTTGELQLAQGDGGVTARLAWSFRKPEVVVERRGDAMVVTVRCDELGPVQDQCEVDLRVEVPRGTALDAEAEQVDASELAGDLRVRTRGGDVTVEDHDGMLDAKTLGGDVAVLGGRGDLVLESRGGGVSALFRRADAVRARSYGGDVRLDAFPAPPSSIDVQSLGGDVDLGLPDSAAYAVEVETRGGDRFVAVREDDASPRRVRAESLGGDVSVRPAG